MADQEGTLLVLKKYEESALLSKRVYDLLNTLDILTGDYTIPLSTCLTLQFMNCLSLNNSFQ